VAHHGRVGREPEIARVDPEEDVVHATIPHDHHLVNPPGQDPGLPADRFDLLVEKGDDPSLELSEVGGVELGEGDPGHEIAAERRLGIIPGGDGIFWRSRQTVPAALKRAGRHGLQHTRHALFVGIEGKSREVIGRGARVEARCGYRHLENPCKIGARILARIRRLSLGNSGDVAPVGEGVSELGIDHGPGYRVYFRQHGQTVVVLPAGGDKRIQQRDIERAKALARNL